jgi:hypothetical protein
MNLYHQMYKAKAIHLKEMISNVNMHLTTTPQEDHLWWTLQMPYFNLFAFISTSWRNIIYIPKHYVIPIIFPKGRHLLVRFVNILNRLFFWLQCLGIEQPLVRYSKSFLTLDVVITPLLILFDSMNMHKMYVIVFFVSFNETFVGYIMSFLHISIPNVF